MTARDQILQEGQRRAPASDTEFERMRSPWQDYWNNSFQERTYHHEGGREAERPEDVVLSATYSYMSSEGLPVYRLRVRLASGTTITRDVALNRDTGLLTRVTDPGIPGSTIDVQREQSALDSAKDKLLTELTTIYAQSTALHGLSNGMPLLADIGIRVAEIQTMEELEKFARIAAAESLLPGPEFEAVFEDVAQEAYDFGPSGGGGGGGFAAPIYVAPDRRVVEDFVKGTMVSLVGTVLDDKVQEMTDLYMADHRKNWDTQDRVIDPSQSVLEAMRLTSEYKHVHKLRPDSEDERYWVSQRRTAAAQGGLTQGSQEDYAIMQAAAGGDLADVARGAGATQASVSGSSRGTILENTVRSAAGNLFRGVKR